MINEYTLFLYNTSVHSSRLQVLHIYHTFKQNMNIASTTQITLREKASLISISKGQCLIILGPNFKQSNFTGKLQHTTVITCTVCRFQLNSVNILN